MTTRRRVLGACGAVASVSLAGCVDALPDDREPSTGPCEATAPPVPTDAAADARDYPDEPDELTTESVESFLRAYEAAHQYNAALAASPNKVGRTNEISVEVETVSVQADGGRFTATVSGRFASSILEETPTAMSETALPRGHGPFEATYVVSDRSVRREGVVVECW